MKTPSDLVGRLMAAQTAKTNTRNVQAEENAKVSEAQAEAKSNVSEAQAEEERARKAFNDACSPRTPPIERRV
jgi:hypothetical protein